MRKPLYILLIAAILAIGVLTVMNTSKRTNWNATFSASDKIPFGTYILNSGLDDLFPNSEIYYSTKSIYEELIDYDEVDYMSIKNPSGFTNYISYNQKACYIIFNQYNSLDESSSKELLNWVSKGNHAFIAAQYFSNDILLDSLGLSWEINPGKVITYKLGFDSVQCLLNFTNPELVSDQRYEYYIGDMSSYFSIKDTANIRVLGTTDGIFPNFVSVKFGKGEFLLSTAVFAFTNINMLSERGADYVSKCLSYIPTSYPIEYTETTEELDSTGNLKEIYIDSGKKQSIKLIWDEHNKGFNQHSNSPLRYLLSTNTLSWAYWLFLTLIAMIMFFGIKRKQRLIPVITKPKNSSVEFVRTMANLYLKESSNSDIARKKVLHFFEFLHSNNSVSNSKQHDIEELDADFLATKFGIEINKIQRLIALIAIAKKRYSITNEQLQELNSIIDEFYIKGKYD